MVSKKNIVMSDAASCKQLQWIESTGTQYIDTGVAVTTSTGFELEIKEFKSTVYGCFGCTMQCDDPSAAEQDRWTRFQVGRRDNVIGSTNLFWGIWSRNYHSTYTPIDFSREHVLRYIPAQDPKFYVDSTTYAIGQYPPTSDNPVNYYLFATNDYPTSGVYMFCSAVLKRAKLWDGDQLVRDMVPVLHDGVAAMYDLVTKQVFLNNGTGEFIAGPEVEEQQ